MRLFKRLLMGSAITLLVLLVLTVLLAVGLTHGLQQLVADWGGPATLVIDDQSVVIGNLDFGQSLLVVGVLLLVGMLLLSLVPLLLGIVGMALLVAVGAPLLALAAVFVVVGSPLLLLAGIVYLLLRKPKAPTTMGA